MASSLQRREVTRTDTRHVEAVEEGLDGAVDVRRLALALELEDSLRDRRHDGVMSSLDVGENLRKPFVVIVHLRRPLDARIGIRVVAVGARKGQLAAPPLVAASPSSPVSERRAETILDLLVIMFWSHVLGE